MSATVVQHVLSRLRDIGIRDVFGVPGDYTFPIDNAICSTGDIRWIGCCSELNAAFAADGYARINGAGALSTTYGVGELGAINGIAGAYAEHVPIFHLVGIPSAAVQEAGRGMSHSLGGGSFDLFYEMADAVVCARAVMTPTNCIAETERLIEEALRQRRPVYMAFPSDYANMPVMERDADVAGPNRDPIKVAHAVATIVRAINASQSTCVLPGVLIARNNLQEAAIEFVDASGLPFATMLMDKGVLDESHPQYIGMYDGRLMNGYVRAFVERSDVLLSIGTLVRDFNTGSFAERVDPRRCIEIREDRVVVGGEVVFDNVPIADVLRLLAQCVTRRPQMWVALAPGLGAPIGEPDENIDIEYLYPRWEKMLKEDDILIAESGTCSMGMGFARLPRGGTFHSQSLWGAIGWATSAAFGAAIAAPDRRTILITGDGAHQLTAQDVSQFARYGLKPLIFVLNDEGNRMERLLCGNPEARYNDLNPWAYHKLPEVLGCKGWFTAQVTTCGELDRAIEQATCCEAAAYIEVITDRYSVARLSQKLREAQVALFAVDRSGRPGVMLVPRS